MPLARSVSPRRFRRATACAWGFTLIEVMISVGVLALGTMGGISAFMILNRYAANLRNTSVARALCQERIEQALTLAFAPTSAAVPLAPNSDSTTKSGTPYLPILGALTVYNTATGAYTGGNNLQTSSETIPVYTQSDGTSASASANVTYTRTTTVSSSGLNYVTSAGATTASINLLQFTVTVSWVFHGQPYSTSMSTLRGAD